MASIRTTTMYYDTLKFVYAILRKYNCLCIKVSWEVQFERVLEAIIHFHPLEGIVVEVEPIKINRKNWGELLNTIPFKSIGLIIAAFTEKLVVSI